MIDVISISSSEDDVFRLSTPSTDSSVDSDWSQNLIWIEDPCVDGVFPSGIWAHVDDCKGDVDGSLSVDSWFQQRSKYNPSNR
jgi:hypothetical protein